MSDMRDAGGKRAAPAGQLLVDIFGNTVGDGAWIVFPLSIDSDAVSLCITAFSSR
jgi:hypothetical protein